MKGGIFKDKLKINNDVNIYKISNNVFCYDKIDMDEKYLKNISNLLDKGTKFVPYLINNDFEFYSNFYKDIDNALVKFNFSIFTEKIKNKEKEKQIIINENNLNFSTTDTVQIEDNTNKTLIKKSKRNVNYSNIPTQIETNELRNQLFKEINLIGRNKSIRNNLNHEEIETLNHFCLNKPFKVLRCDKNVGTIIISNENENKLANKILNDKNMYKKTDTDQTQNIINIINEKINNLLINDHISKDIFNKLIINDPDKFKCGNLKIQPKIHKKDFGIRQIISCINHPTSILCETIHNMINPFVKSVKHILKDSQQLIQETNNIHFTSDKVFLYSCDFESLYSNIKPADAIPKICNFLYYETDILRKNKIDYIGIKEILEMIFKYSNFKYNDEHYMQLNGIPMGCICGPSIANLYVYLLEREWLNKHQNIIYYRFIDDIFIASTYEINLDEFKQNFGYLKLNIECNKKVNFLDLELSINKISNKLNFNLYIKPTNTFGYLLPTSNHPTHIFDNIPISLIKRIKRICSNYEDYLYHANNLAIQLAKRNYNLNKLKGIINEIGKIDRNTLIPYNTNTINIGNKLKFFMKHNLCYDFLKNSIYNLYKKLSTDCNFLHKNIIYINTINNNLGSLFIDNFKNNIIKNFKYNRCNQNAII